MAIEPRKPADEDKAEAPASITRDALEPIVQTDAKEPTKKQIKDSRVTDGQDMRERDPNYGTGGTYAINESGVRVRVNDKGEEIKPE